MIKPQTTYLTEYNGKSVKLKNARIAKMISMVSNATVLIRTTTIKYVNCYPGTTLPNCL